MGIVCIVFRHLLIIHPQTLYPILTGVTFVCEYWLFWNSRCIMSDITVYITSAYVYSTILTSTAFTSQLADVISNQTVTRHFKHQTTTTKDNPKAVIVHYTSCVPKLASSVPPFLVTLAWLSTLTFHILQR